jgi:hypothetical protein
VCVKAVMRAIKRHKVPSKKAKTDSASYNAAIVLSIFSTPSIIMLGFVEPVAAEINPLSFVS